MSAEKSFERKGREGHAKVAEKNSLLQKK